MFKSPFSFDGRIRRTEFGITFIILTAFFVFLGLELKNDDGMVLMAAVPLLWLVGAQGAKRCHDIGKNGWWQCIPFYFVILLIKDGAPGFNQYGEDPKERVAAEIPPMAIANDTLLSSTDHPGNTGENIH